jgi:hypothetical protein
MKRQLVRFELRREKIRVLADRELKLPAAGGPENNVVQTEAVQHCTPK